jgi:hypothetical protein
MGRCHNKYEFNHNNNDHVNKIRYGRISYKNDPRMMVMNGVERRGRIEVIAGLLT